MAGQDVLDQMKDEVNKDSNSNSAKSVVVCEVCGVTEARYRCPGCLMQTCSVPCVKQHKEISGCSGQRDKTSYLPLQEFTETHLLSDYRFLEETGRKVDIASKDVRRFQSKSRPVRVTTFLKHARQRGVELQLMPYPMTKRKINTSMYHYASKSVHWRVEWMFPHEHLTFTDKGFKDTQLLREGVEGHVQVYMQKCPSSHPQTPCGAQPPLDLSLYTEEGGRRYRIVMKVEGLLGKQKRFYEMDIEKNLGENLRCRRVIEFPQLLVIPEHLFNSYISLSKDEEEELRKPRHQQHTSLPRPQPCYTEDDLFDPGSSIYSV